MPVNGSQADARSAAFRAKLWRLKQKLKDAKGRVTKLTKEVKSMEDRRRNAKKEENRPTNAARVAKYRRN